MGTTSVTSKGQVTIPKPVRQRLGIRQGSQVEFTLVGDHVELRVRSSPAAVPASGFGMLKSRKRAVPAGFDPAELLKAPASPRRRAPLKD
ncbi:MAG: AbrB/MazE/SpoVT family DNA-binding domain-containing protein [Acidobacteria bacterium]|nr:AbrB/MazE/SpoVT family DNA-binding domain-containing protein [Acidobacteriota bacterium]